VLTFPCIAHRVLDVVFEYEFFTTRVIREEMSNVKDFSFVVIQQLLSVTLKNVPKSGNANALRL